jgi:hypothetical protein
MQYFSINAMNAMLKMRKASMKRSTLARHTRYIYARHVLLTPALNPAKGLSIAPPLANQHLCYALTRRRDRDPLTALLLPSWLPTLHDRCLHAHESSFTTNMRELKQLTHPPSKGGTFSIGFVGR